jgi:hypothetical protein
MSSYVYAGNISKMTLGARGRRTHQAGIFAKSDAAYCMISGPSSAVLSGRGGEGAGLSASRAKSAKVIVRLIFKFGEEGAIQAVFAPGESDASWRPAGLFLRRRCVARQAQII